MDKKMIFLPLLLLIVGSACNKSKKLNFNSKGQQESATSIIGVKTPQNEVSSKSHFTSLGQESDVAVSRLPVKSSQKLIGKNDKLINKNDFELLYNDTASTSNPLSINYNVNATVSQHSLGVRFINNRNGLMSYFFVNHFKELNSNTSVSGNQFVNHLDASKKLRLEKNYIGFAAGVGFLF